MFEGLVINDESIGKFLEYLNKDLRIDPNKSLKQIILEAVQISNNKDKSSTIDVVTQENHHSNSLSIILINLRQGHANKFK